MNLWSHRASCKMNSFRQIFFCLRKCHLSNHLWFWRPKFMATFSTAVDTTTSVWFKAMQMSIGTAGTPLARNATSERRNANPHWGPFRWPMAISQPASIMSAMWCAVSLTIMCCGGTIFAFHPSPESCRPQRRSQAFCFSFFILTPLLAGTNIAKTSLQAKIRFGL